MSFKLNLNIFDNNEDVIWLQQQFKILRRSRVEIGILGSESSDILIIAGVNEFGAQITVTDKMRGYLAANGLHLKASTTEINIPERSFIRRTADEKERDIINFISRQYDRLFARQINAKQLLNALGEFCVGITKRTLIDVKNPPNHPFTLQRKAPRTNPLVNSGTLVNRISFEVRT